MCERIELVETVLSQLFQGEALLRMGRLLRVAGRHRHLAGQGGRGASAVTSAKGEQCSHIHKGEQCSHIHKGAQ